jgi:hypothetical protein
MEHQYRACVRDYLLEIPTGTMEAGESPISYLKAHAAEIVRNLAVSFTELWTRTSMFC